jgi:hypothetical protein
MDWSSSWIHSPGGKYCNEVLAAIGLPKNFAIQSLYLQLVASQTQRVAWKTGRRDRELLMG